MAEEKDADQTDALKVYWEHFFNAETGSYEKSTWLDLFLAEFLIRVNDGADPKHLIGFCPLSGVVSLVGCELLCGIHRVTSSINTHYSVPLPGFETTSCFDNQLTHSSNYDFHDRLSETTDEASSTLSSQPGSLFTKANSQSSAEILKKYLLGGIAWRCLLLLKILGVEGLSCCRQLSSVLIWVFGELSSGGNDASSGGATEIRVSPLLPRLSKKMHTPIHHLFSQRIWSKQKTSQDSKYKFGPSSDKVYVAGRSKHSDKIKETDSKIKKKSIKQNDQTTDSDGSEYNNDLQVLNRSMTIKVSTPNDDFEYFNSTKRFSNELSNESIYSDSYHAHTKTKPKAEIYTNDRHKEIMDSEISTFEFTLIIIDLLQELCKAESSLSGSEGSQVSVQCINFSLRNLCSLQFGSLPVCSLQYDAHEVSKIKVELTELMIVSLDKVLIRADLCTKLINNGILPMLLRILEDVICKSSSKYHTKAEEQNSLIDLQAPNKSEAENLLKFVFGIAYSITAFFHCLLMQCRSVDNLREFTDQFKLYGECLKGDLLKECVELMIRIPAVNQHESVILIKRLIESIGKLVSGMKRIRSEIVHSAACPKNRHKACRQRVAAGMHHHHDILGESTPGIPLAPACCVSVLYGSLTSLITDEEMSAHPLLRNKILRVMLNCGVCCCFSPGFLMESVVRLMLTHPIVASLSLHVLEHTVYGELGAGVLIPKVTDQLPCAVCELCDDRLVKKYCPHGITPKERKNVSSFLIHYNSLLQLDNHNNVLQETVSHLLRMTPKCRMEVKYELLFSVIYPTFIVAKHRYIIRLEDSAYFLTVSCLNIFAGLLNTVSFAEQFIQKGGLSYVLELISLPEFSKQCCSILEIAIIVEIFELMKLNPNITYLNEMSALTSVQMLFDSLSEMSEKCYKIYRLKLPADKFDELSDVTKEREILAMMPRPMRRGSEQIRRLSLTKPIKTPYATSENVIEDCIEDYIEVLKNVCTFWKSCSGLCLYSPVFRRLVAAESVFVESYALLKVVLHCVCRVECTVPEMRVLVKIAEALLTVQFATADVTSGRSKEVSGDLVRAALSSLEGDAGCTGGERGAGLRALCEALIRVATAAPSPHHTMPKLAHAKMPPLLCPSGGSSLECSSSEDSVSGPYASDSESITHHPDEGYEADIELGKLNLSCRTRKISDMLSSISIDPVPSELMMMECNEYSRSGELAHPELCVIVFDILTQLIDKLVTSKEVDGEYSAVSRVCVALARTCCARLAAALPPAGVAARPLLQRLLAPAAAGLLAHSAPHLFELQSSILELIHVLASQSIEPGELGALVRLVRAPRPPLAALLAALRRLVAAAVANTPDTILTFPIDSDRQDDVMQSMSEELSHLVLNSATSQSHQSESMTRTLHDAHIDAGIRSVWSCGAVRCSVSAGWAPWLHGFATAAWLRVAASPHTHAHQDAHRHHSPGYTQHWDSVDSWKDDSYESKCNNSPLKKETSLHPAELSHVFSIGHDSLMFEVWLDTNTGTFTFRLSRPDTNSYKVLSESTVDGSLPPHQWSFIALNVKEIVHKRKIHIQVTLFVNGCECETVSLPLQGLLVRKVTPTNVVVGDSRPGGAGASAGESSAGGAYHLSGVTVYRAPVFTAHTALHLTAHGPDQSCQVRCESPNFPLVITPTSLDCNIDWDQVYEISSAILRELHDSVLFTFAASAPNIINLYHQTAAVPTVFSGRVSSTASLMSSSGVQASPGTGHGAPIPETLFPVWTAAPLLSRHRGLPPALYMLGGPDVLLYLFARVVELDGSEEEQANALWVLLRCCRADNRLYGALYTGDTLTMLHTVFASPKCHVSKHMLKVLFEEACSSPVVWCNAEGAGVAARGDCVLLEPMLLVFLTRAWRHLDNLQEVRWEMDEMGTGGGEWRRGSLWALALCAMRALLRDEHPRRAFNHYQMNRVDLLNHLLLACKERFLNSECGPLDESASESLVELVRGLMGAPPLLCHLAMLCDFLILMHQASDTFITHSRANFYFLLTSETQDTSDFNFLNFVSKRKTSKRVKRKSRSESSSSSVTTEGAGTDHNINVLKQPSHGRENMYTADGDSSVDSTKQMKGLINIQIKEDRKNDNSSTLGNAETVIDGTTRQETTPTDGGGLEEMSKKGDDTLNDYIVVESDDVNHTTVEMFSSGIYEQKRVRAGAAPDWSACEGLLLLLRDAVEVLPDHALTQAVCGAIQPESLVVLANHRSASVRAAVVRVVGALARRAPQDLRKRTLHFHYYLHLANQISLYPGSWQLAAACAALLTKCDVSLHDQLDEDIWVDVNEECLLRSSPLLALLPCCLHDVPLAHNITLILRRTIDKASLKLLNELSLAEVVVRCIRSVGMKDDFEGKELLLDDLNELLNRIAIKALAMQHSMQTVCELHLMLTYIESTAASPAVSELSEESDEVTGVRRVARDAHCALFHAQLDYLEERLHASFATVSKPASYFSTVLSSAVSLNAEVVSRSELASRHLSVVWRCVNFLLSQSPTLPLYKEAPLLDRLLHTLFSAVSGSTSTRSKWWVNSGAEWTAALQEVFWWACSPARGARRVQASVLRALYAHPHAAHALAPQDPPAMRKLTVYLLTMLKHLHGEAESGAAGIELAITDWARSWALSTQASMAERVSGEGVWEEALALLRADEARWTRAARAPRHRAALGKVVFGKEGVASKLTETAMCMTRQVVELQNSERKAFMEHLRRAQNDAVTAAQRWHRLLDAYTHEQALWHDPASYPQSWQLDPTEGPARVRVRLRRAHLNIRARFLKPHAQYKAELKNHSPPLRSVVGGGGGGWGRGAQGGVVARLQPNETVSYMARVTYVTVASDTVGELLLSDRWIHFVPEEREHDTEQTSPSAERCGAHSWPLEAIVNVATRRWCLQELAAELFLNTGHAHLLAFEDLGERTAFLKALDTCHLPNRTEPETLTEATNAWRNGTITNWEYIMKLNGLAGRSYNDLMQYPVLPFVIADYTSRILDLNDPASFRDLTKPMAVQNKSREQHYIKTYNDLKLARREGCSPLLSRQPHHYASLYSNSGGVLHYLVRLPPFTELFLKYQDNNFDMPDRTFHSLATTWRLITNDSPTDVKELIPELFYLPELFHNNEELELGVRQCGAGVDSVELPAWAADARLFTLAHRQALESPIVTDMLPHWIDLVFGYKQTGQPAIDSINVFPACTYYGFDPSALEDEVDRTAAAAMVRTYGQAPRQLLRQPHPHQQADLLSQPEIEAPCVWSGVAGARWGRYCGSPALPPPAVVARRPCPAATSMHALPPARAVAAATRATALLALHSDAVAAGATGSAVQSSLALLSWGHTDSIVRLKRRRDQCPDLVMKAPALDQITAVATSCSSAGCPVLVGHSSGRVVALRLRVGAGGMLSVRTQQLHAHAAPVSDAHVSRRATLAVTASIDGNIVLWDLNTLSYIRTVPNRDMLTVRLVTISATLCDVASVHEFTSHEHAHAQVPASVPPNTGYDDSDSYEKHAAYKYKSLIRVHTVNGSFVGSVKVMELVTCVCYSSGAEGVSVNCVAAALDSGGVRLYSAWDLRPVTYVPPADSPRPLCSITFSSDSQLLFGCYADGVVVAWESGGAAGAGGGAGGVGGGGTSGRAQSVRIHPAHALF